MIRALESKMSHHGFYGGDLGVLFTLMSAYRQALLVGAGQSTMMLCDYKCNCRVGGKHLQSATGFVTSIACMLTAWTPESVPALILFQFHCRFYTIFLFFYIDYWAPSRGAKYCDEHVCLSTVHSHISKIRRPNFTKFSVYVIQGCGLVLLRWRWNTLCTSGFVVDIMFSYNGPYGV